MFSDCGPAEGPTGSTEEGELGRTNHEMFLKISSRVLLLDTYWFPIPARVPIVVGLLFLAEIGDGWNLIVISVKKKINLCHIFLLVLILVMQWFCKSTYRQGTNLILVSGSL